MSNLPIVMIAGVVGFAGNEAVALSEEVRHRLLHQVRRLDTAVIHVNPCTHSGADPHEMTSPHEPAS
jgi:hypothetical protein